MRGTPVVDGRTGARDRGAARRDDSTAIMDSAQLAWTPRPREIAVMRALPGLGDFLCATPALRALRAALPGARITLIGLESTRPLVARYPHLVDELLAFPGFPGLPELPPDLDLLPQFLKGTQGRFDLALQLHGDGAITNTVVRLLGARAIAGFYAPPHPCPDPATFLPYPDGLAEPRILLSLLGFLGVPARGESLEFPLDPADLRALDDLLCTFAVPQHAELALVHVGAARPQRRLDPRLLAVVVDGLAARGLFVALTGGPDEVHLAAAVKAYAESRPLDLVGRTGLGTLGALVRRARLVVSGDTGVSHLASALRTPSVIVFLASDPSRWAPLDRVRHRVLDATVLAPTPAAILAEADATLALSGVGRA